MTNDEFNVQMDRMRSCFGKQHYVDVQRIEMIWGYVQDAESITLAAVVNHFIATSRRAPLPIDFKDAMSAEKKTYSGGLANLRTEIKCYKCQDIGTISAWRMGVRYKHCSTYAFKCPDLCAVSMTLSNQIQVWGPRYDKEFFPIFGINKTPDQIWSERHEEFYGFPESDRFKGNRKVNPYMQDLTMTALSIVRGGPIEVPDVEDIDVF